MNSNAFRLPAHRWAAAATVVALAGVPVFLAAPARATDAGGADLGRASASVLRAGLDVSLLNKGVHVPLDAALNEVTAPASAQKKALSVRLDGVDGGRPVRVLSAEVADARATVGKDGAEGDVKLVHARVHVPGLPLLSLVEVQQVTSAARCESGEKPVAESDVLGGVTVLGRRVTVTAGGPTKVSVPGVGDVTLQLSQRSTTSRTAAATALSLHVSVNPLKLNVADVEGSVTLASASCTTPSAHHRAAPSTAPAAPGKPGTPRSGASAPADPARPADPAGLKADGGKPADLAETGGSSTTPYLAGGAAVLVVAGAGAVTLSRRRRASR